MNLIQIRKSMNAVSFTSRVCKAFLLLILLSMGASSCSSGDDISDHPQNYYFRASLDNRKVDFHSVIFQGSGNDNRWEHIVVGGNEKSTPTDGSLPSPSLDFEIWRQGGDIKAGTYTTPAEQGMIARYAVQTNNGTLIYNTSVADDVFTLHIESIGKDGIKGTFSGKVRSMEGQVIDVTEGSFNLPYNEIINP